PAAWLTTVVARVCLNMLRSRGTRREEPLEEQLPAKVAGARTVIDPEEEALLADSVGLALLVVLDTLSPAERLAFVLHDLFDIPFDEIGSIVGRSPTAARQLASRARRRVQHPASVPPTTLRRQRQVVDAFLAASRQGDFEALVSLLDPDVVLRADAAASPSGRAVERRGARVVSRGALAASTRTFHAEPALVNGSVGLVYAPRGRLAVVLAFQFNGDTISAIDVIGDAERLEALDLALLDG
ncbi:MAG TPA: sigma factor-like helix-turn-helix DNA-binding protein, partial [Acidimicrobiales bacterium]|nr:sigma factor-like helix-turn-helix DNA-binding protein [Acidimicrobiales bacterium]